MESIFFDLNPSMRQFTDNALRSNSMLHRAQNNAEGKTKTSRAAKSAKASISMEAGVSGEDMMGGMDLGDFRGGGSGFETFSGRTDDDDESERSSRQPRLSEMLASMKSSFSGASAAMSPSASPVSAPAVAESDGGGGENAAETASPASGGAAVSADSPASSPDPSPAGGFPVSDAGGLSPEAVSELSSSAAEPRSDPVADSPAVREGAAERGPDGKSSPKAGPRTGEGDSVHVEAAKERRSSGQSREERKAPSEWNSLLSFDEGFLIAENEKFSPAASVAEEDDSAPSFEEISVDVSDDVSADSSVIVSSMLCENDLTQYELSVLNYYLGSFGKRILKKCLDFGVRIWVRSSPDRGFYSGGYSRGDKVCSVSRESLSRKEEFVSARFYMAMAFDHALGDGEFSSSKSPAVLSSWRLCRDFEPGHMFQDSFSASDPSLYFAQSVESYLRGPEDAAPDSPLFGHDELYDYDRSMFSYIDYLFGKFIPKEER